MAQRTCSIDGCDKTAQARGWCPMHYQRWRHHGDPATVTPRGPRDTVYKPRPPGSQPCAVDGCERECDARGLCHKHYEYERRSGDLVTGYSKVREANPNWKGDAVTPGAVHIRLGRYRGPARTYDCVDCGEPAYDWAFDEPTGFSTDLSRYRPLCRRCHMRDDDRARCNGRKST